MTPRSARTRRRRRCATRSCEGLSVSRSLAPIIPGQLVPEGGSRARSRQRAGFGVSGDAVEQAAIIGRGDLGADGPRLIVQVDTNQRETTLLWERAIGPRALHRAIVWQDRRTAPSARPCAARRGGDPRLRACAGLLWTPYFSGTKIAVAARLPGAVRYATRAARGELAFGTMDNLGDPTSSTGGLHVDGRHSTPRAPCLMGCARSPGTTASSPRLERAAGHPCPEICPTGSAGVVGHTPGRRGPLRRDSHRRHRGRPAGSPLRPGVLSAPGT